MAHSIRGNIFRWKVLLFFEWVFFPMRNRKDCSFFNISTHRCFPGVNWDWLQFDIVRHLQSIFNVFEKRFSSSTEFHWKSKSKNLHFLLSKWSNRSTFRIEIERYSVKIRHVKWILFYLPKRNDYNNLHTWHSQLVATYRQVFT